MEKVYPGSRITLTERDDNMIVGDGLYTHNGQVYASRVGYLRRERTPPLVESEEEGNRMTLSVWPSSPAIPAIGQNILGTITRLTSKYAAVDIRVIESNTTISNSSTKSVYLTQPFRGTLRATEIWPEADREAASQPLYRSFRPGDLIRARVIGVGEAAAGFLLSTAIDLEFGVVYARCAASGEPMVSVSWREMMCSKTGIREPRKAAKPTV